MEEIIPRAGRDAEEELIDRSEEGAFSRFILPVNEMDVVFHRREFETESGEGPKGGDIEGVKAHLLFGVTGGDAMEDDGGNLFLKGISVLQLGESGGGKLGFERGDGGGFLDGIKVGEGFQDKGGEVVTLREFLRIVGRRGAELEALEPELLGVDLARKAGALGLPAGEVAVEEAVEGGRSGEGEAEGEEPVAKFLEGLGEADGNFFEEGFFVGDFREVEGEVGPADDIKRDEGVRGHFEVVVDFHKGAAARAEFVDLAALDISGIDDPGLFLENGGLVDVAERPVVVVLFGEVSERAGRVSVVLRASGEAGVKEADIEAVWDRFGIC